MGNGYFAYSNDFYRFYPEYEKNLGKALGPAEMKEDYWERMFSHAVVRVWPEEKRGEIEYR
jgi:hypothetical protein